MKALKNGDFTCTLELSTDQEAYEFRYLLDQNQWENDWEADAYVPNMMTTENSVISSNQGIRCVFEDGARIIC